MIPKILHSVWVGNAKPRLDYRNQWKDVFDDTWEIIHWDDSMLSEFKVDYDFPPTLMSDYLRLLILQKYGGIYADVDMMFFKPLDDFLHHKSFFTYQLPPIDKPKEFKPKGISLKECIQNRVNVFNFYNKDIYCNNNLIGSEPNSNAINTYINLFKEDKEKPVSERFSYVDYGAGPSMTTYLINQYVEVDGYTKHCDELSVYDYKVFHPTNYTQYQEQVIRRRFEDSIEDQILIAKEYDSYCVHFQTSTEVNEYLKK